MSLFNIRSLADLRAFAYVLLPVVSTMLVGYGVLDDGRAQLWGALVTAVLGPVIAAFNARTISAFRTAFYVTFGAVQALVVGYGLANDAQFATWMPLVVALVGLSAGGVAVANTDTTPSAP